MCVLSFIKTWLIGDYPTENLIITNYEIYFGHLQQTLWPFFSWGTTSFISYSRSKQKGIKTQWCHTFSLDYPLCELRKCKNLVGIMPSKYCILYILNPSLIVAKLSFNFNSNFNLDESWVSINFIFNIHTPNHPPPPHTRKKILKKLSFISTTT